MTVPSSSLVERRCQKMIESAQNGAATSVERAGKRKSDEIRIIQPNAMLPGAIGSEISFASSLPTVCSFFLSLSLHICLFVFHLLSSYVSFWASVARWPWQGRSVCRIRVIKSNAEKHGRKIDRFSRLSLQQEWNNHDNIELRVSSGISCRWIYVTLVNDRRTALKTMERTDNVLFAAKLYFIYIPGSRHFFASHTHV